MSIEKKIDTKINFSSNAFKKYLSNTSWLFFEKVIRLIVTFLVGIYLVRYLGPNDFGILSYAISFVGLFAAFATFGLDNIVIRDLVKDESKKDYLLGTSFILRFTGAVASVVLILISISLISETAQNKILIIIISVSTIFQAFNIVDFYFKAKVIAKYSAMVQFSAMLLSSLFKVLLILINAPLIYFAIATASESLFLAFGFGLTAKLQKINFFNWQFDFKLAKRLLNDSWPLILSGVVVSIYMKIDQVIIKHLLTDEKLGYYAAAVRLSEAWYFIPVAISASLFPAIINAKKTDESLYISRLQKLYDILAWISMFIAIPVTFFSDSIIRILFGTKFLPASPVLTVYIWAGVAVFLGVGSSQFLINENYTKISFGRTFLGMALNVILHFLFIPLWGIVGSEYASLISFFVATFSLVFSKKTSQQFKLMMKAVFLIDLFTWVLKKWLYLLKKK